MKKFAYKFTKLNTVLSFVFLFLAFGCLAANVKRIIDISGAEEATLQNFLSCGLAALVGLIGMVVIIPVIASSSYEVTDKAFVKRMGIIKTSIPLDKITRVTLFRNTKCLVVYYNQSDFVNVSIDEKDFDAFIDALKEGNSKIFYCLDSENSGEK